MAIGLTVLTIATFVLALEQLSPATANPGAAAECQQGFVLDFAKFPDGTSVPRGTLLNEQYASVGIHIDAVANEGRPDQLIVFDSNRTDTRDPDLEANLGNLAIIPEHLIDDNGDGLVDDPNDSIRGGKQIYTFDTARFVGSFIIVDIDHGVPASHHADAYDAVTGGNLIKTVPIPIQNDGDFQTITVNASGVRRLEIVYRDSAGVTGIEIDCPPGTPTPTPTPPGGTPTPTPPGSTPTPTPPGGTPTPTPTGGTPTATPPGGTPTPTPTSPGATPTPTPSAATPTPTPNAVAGIASQPAVAQIANQAPAGGGRPDDSSFPIELLLLAAGWAGILLGAVMLRRPQA